MQGASLLNPTDRLTRDAALLGVTLSEADARRLLLLLDELAHWNRSFNLTAITEREAMVTHHLLDSLSINGDLEGQEIADVGTGAGFPGLPLAVANPQRRFTLIARALAPLPRLLELVEPMCAPGTRVLAMKGRRPDEELAALPEPWKLLGARELTVPGLAAARCVLVLGR